MRLNDIHIKNFLSIENVRVEFPQGLISVTGINKDVAGSNSNGSGKSALFDAISWVLFGNTLRTIDKDSVIRRGSEQAEVELILSTGKDGYLINRRRGKETSLTLYFVPDSDLEAANDLTASTVSLTQDKINSILGMDYKTFLAVATFDLDILRFARATDKEQKEILERILNLEVYGIALEKCRKEIADKDRALLLVNENKKFLDQQLLQLQEEKTNIQLLKKDYNNNLEKSKSEISQRIIAFEYANTSINEVIKEAKAEQEQLQKKLALPITKNPWINSLQDAKIQHNGHSYNLNTLKVQEKRLSDTIDSVENRVGKPCGECGRVVTKEQVNHILESNAEQILETLDKIPEVKQNISISEEAIRNYQEKYDKFEQEQMESNKIRANANSRLSALSVIIRQSDSTQRENEKKIVQLNMELRSLESRGTDFDNQITKISEKIEKANQQLKEKQIAADILVDNMAVLKYWEKGFGYGGIRSVLLDDVCAQLTQKCNEYLKHLMGGTLWIDIRTQSMNKAGDRKEKLEVQTFNSFGAGTYYGLSKGEAQRVDFCLALALQNIAKNRNKNPLGFAIFDEVLERLDSSGCDQVISLLHKERNNLGTIFLVSNNENLTTNFKNKIEFIKQNGITKCISTKPESKLTGIQENPVSQSDQTMPVIKTQLKPTGKKKSKDTSQSHSAKPQAETKAIS